MDEILSSSYSNILIRIGLAYCVELIMALTEKGCIFITIVSFTLFVLYGLINSSLFLQRPIMCNMSCTEMSHSDEASPALQTKVKSIELRTPDQKLIAGLDKKSTIIERVTDPGPLSATCKEHVFLTILVASAPRNFEQRNSIRGSWASTYHRHTHTFSSRKPFTGPIKYSPENVVKTVFLIARDKDLHTHHMIETEAKTFGDIVLGNFNEHYRNLTMKTRLGLKWAYYNCRTAFILKTDDDVFVNPVPLVEWIKGLPQTNLYTGWCNFGSPVVRDKSNKWYVSEEDFSEDQYPGYCLGGGYLMSDDVLHRVMIKSYGRKLFPMEDLYVGIMISEFGDIPARDEKKHFDLVFNGRGNCQTRSLFLAHQVEPGLQLHWLNRYEYEEKYCK